MPEIYKGKESKNFDLKSPSGQQCGKNEVYVEALQCEKSCSDDPDKEDEDCTPAIEAGCACKEGFIRR